MLEVLERRGRPHPGSAFVFHVRCCGCGTTYVLNAPSEKGLTERSCVSCAAKARGGRKFFHGGQFGLCPGQFVLSPKESGAANTLLSTAHNAGVETPARDDVVYVTSSREAALMFAAMHPSGGCVYEVRPIGTLRADPDCKLEGLSFECERALILSSEPVTCFEREQVAQAMFA